MSFHSSILPEEGSYWLPLLSGPNDQIKELPYTGLSLLWIQLSTDSLMVLSESSEGSDPDYTYEEESLSDLKKKILILQDQLNGVQSESEELNKNLKQALDEKEIVLEELKDANQKIEEQSKAQHYLEEEVKKLRSQLSVPNTPSNRAFKASFDLDQKVQSKLREVGKPGLLKRLGENVYMLDNKKVKVDLKAGELVCSIDGVSKTFGEVVGNMRRRGASNKTSNTVSPMLSRTLGIASSGFDFNMGLLTPYRERRVKNNI